MPTAKMTKFMERNKTVAVTRGTRLTKDGHTPEHTVTFWAKNHLEAKVFCVVHGLKLVGEL